MVVLCFWSEINKYQEGQFLVGTRKPILLLSCLHPQPEEVWRSQLKSLPVIQALNVQRTQKARNISQQNFLHRQTPNVSGFIKKHNSAKATKEQSWFALLLKTERKERYICRALLFVTWHWQSKYGRQCCQITNEYFLQQIHWNSFLDFNSCKI